jgi:hypothetical protein
MASAKKAEVVVPELVDTVKVRAQGLTLLAPLTPEVRALRVTTPVEYLSADELLGRVRNARSRWKMLMDPIVAPLARMKADLKLQEAGIKNLNNEVDGPMETLELRVKESMRLYKMEEAKQIQAAREEEARAERERQEAIAEMRRKEEAAKTVQMRAKLAQKRADLEEEAVQASMVDLNPVAKGASSSVRSIQKIRVTNLAVLVAALADYQPKAGMYQMGVPPLSLINEEMLQVRLNALFREQPGIAASWPGVEVYTDINIAGR